MEALNPDGKASVHVNRMLNKGFNFGYHTHQCISRKGIAWHFCYDQGYLSLDDGSVMLVSIKTGE